MQGSRFAFGPFVLDPEAGTLLRQDTPVPVGHRGLLLLSAFAGRPGEILSRSALMDAAWPGVVVEEGNLTVQIALLRKLLGPSADGGEWIATVPRVGYRFTGVIEALSGAQRRPLPVPDKPSIAVLPFANVGNAPEQQSFADGLTEDLITDLSRISGLFVIARNSVFAYRGKAMDVHRIAHELGVRYLLEGSARRAAGRVRINAQLVDIASGDHLWADRFDRDLEDIFAVQDEVTARIVEALIGRLSSPASRKRPRSIEAYDLCVRARNLVEQSPQASREATLLLRHAIELDPDYAAAHRWLALNLMVGWAIWGEPMEPSRRMAVVAAERAVALDPNDAANHWHLGYVLAYERRWTEADAALENARKLDANNAESWRMLLDLSDLSVLSGRPIDAIEQLGKALRLNPHPTNWYYWALGQAQYAARRYESAVETLRREETYRTGSRRILAASLAQLGRLDEARREAELFMVSSPHFTISYWAAVQPFRDAATLEHFVEGYRKAGLPK